MQIELAGESALIVYFPGEDVYEQNKKVAALTDAFQTQKPEWLVDWVPSYHSVLVEFDLYKTDFLAVKAYLRGLSGKILCSSKDSGRQHTLPVLYGYPNDNDLSRIAEHHGISIQKVIELHVSQTYRVFAVGFSPGFGFLGQVPEQIAMPRLATPRLKVPKGAVAIADRQTAIYPNPSPGGWNILGLCPVELFEPKRTPPAKLQVGDKVTFTAVSKQEFEALGGHVD